MIISTRESSIKSHSSEINKCFYHIAHKNLMADRWLQFYKNLMYCDDIFLTLDFFYVFANANYNVIKQMER